MHTTHFYLSLIAIALAFIAASAKADDQCLDKSTIVLSETTVPLNCELVPVTNDPMVVYMYNDSCISDSDFPTEFQKEYVCSTNDPYAELPNKVSLWDGGYGFKVQHVTESLVQISNKCTHQVVDSRKQSNTQILPGEYFTTVGEIAPVQRFNTTSDLSAAQNLTQADVVAALPRLKAECEAARQTAK